MLEDDNEIDIDTKAFRRRLETLIGTERPFGWAARMGISKGAFTRIWNEGTVPKAELLLRIRERTGVSIDWLLAGADSAQLPASRPEVAVVPEVFQDLVLLPRLDVAASAGAGSVVYSERMVGTVAFGADWVRRTLGVPVERLALITAVGDSMSPTISDGDVLIVLTGEDRIRDNAIYALNFAGELVVKRLSRRRDGSVRIFSDNAAYPGEDVPADEVWQLQVAGRVIWHGGVV